MDGITEWFEKCNVGVESKYVGDIENREPNGQGILTSLDGYKYVGEFYDGNQMVKEHSLHLME